MDTSLQDPAGQKDGEEGEQAPRTASRPRLGPPPASPCPHTPTHLAAPGLALGTRSGPLPANMLSHTGVPAFQLGLHVCALLRSKLGLFWTRVASSVCLVCGLVVSRGRTDPNTGTEVWSRSCRQPQGPGTRTTPSRSVLRAVRRRQGRDSDDGDKRGGEGTFAGPRLWRGLGQESVAPPPSRWLRPLLGAGAAGRCSGAAATATPARNPQVHPWAAMQGKRLPWQPALPPAFQMILSESSTSASLRRPRK